MKIEEFKFWKQNRLDSEFELSRKELKTRFKNWMKSKEPDWLEYYCVSTGFMQTFTGDKKPGLDSVAEPKTYEIMEEILSDTKWEYLNSIGIK